MTIYLHKILPLLASPLSLVIFFALIGIIFKKKIFSIIGLLLLVFCSLPIISNKLIIFLEKDYQPVKISSIEKADAIVVLSGMLKHIKDGNNIKYEFDESVDRIIAGIDLFKNKKAPILILTRGKLPWTKGMPEGEYLKNFVINYGVTEENIILSEEAKNTEEEAIVIKKLIPNNNSKIILVTSAYHMNRAEKIFQKKNLNIVPFPVDFINTISVTTIMDFLPSSYALSKTSTFVREIIGRIYYLIK